ncbi:MAG: type II toxin-antitoxin system VapC family toxin [Vicinamibacterales bacterium]
MSGKRLYADSSFLVSCYLVDANTAQAKAFLSRRPVSLIVTPLHELEVRNALQLGVFRHVLTPEEAKAATVNINEDLRAGRLVKTVARWPAVFRIASRLSERHAARTGTRSLDILHVAVAKTLRVNEFASFDGRQRALATAEGLTDVLASVS